MLRSALAVILLLSLSSLSICDCPAGYWVRAGDTPTFQIGEHGIALELAAAGKPNQIFMYNVATRSAAIWVLPSAPCNSCGGSVVSVALSSPTVHGAGASGTVLSDGRVLIYGGETNEKACTIYDSNPSNPTWTMCSNTSGDDRSFHAATLLADGRVALVGGEEAASTMEILDPGTGSVDGPFPMGGDHGKTVQSFLSPTNSDELVIISGEDPAMSETFIVSATTFSAPVPLFESKRDREFGACPAAGGIIAAGGHEDEAEQTSEIFIGGSWSALPGLTAIRHEPITACLSTGTIMLAGTKESNGVDDQQTAETYDPATNQWCPLPQMGFSHGRRGAGVGLVNGWAAIMGGSTNMDKLDLFVPFVDDGCPDFGDCGDMGGIINNYWRPVSGTLPMNSDVITLDGSSSPDSVTPGALPQVGDQLMIIQLAAAIIAEPNSPNYGDNSSAPTPGAGTLDLQSTGVYEFVTVQSVDVGLEQVTLHQDIVNTYTRNDANGEAYQLVSLAQCKGDALLTSDVECESWNGATGGIIALQIHGELSMNGFSITCTAGFRGGYHASLPNSCTDASLNNYRDDDDNCGHKGEGAAGRPGEVSDTDSLVRVFTTNTYSQGDRCQGAPSNAGGGGNAHNAGGGGGGNGGGGGRGGFSFEGSVCILKVTGARELRPTLAVVAMPTMPAVVAAEMAEVAAGAASLSRAASVPRLTRKMRAAGVSLPAANDRLYFGGGAGAGDCNGNGCPNSPGATGGGIIYADINTINAAMKGIIVADGRNAGTAPNNEDGGGGGGAGGTILLLGSNQAVPGSISAIGGNGGRTSEFSGSGGGDHGTGGGGGGGIVMSMPGGSINTNGGSGGIGASGNFVGDGGNPGVTPNGISYNTVPTATCLANPTPSASPSPTTTSTATMTLTATTTNTGTLTATPTNTLTATPTASLTLTATTTNTGTLTATPTNTLTATPTASLTLTATTTNTGTLTATPTNTLTATPTASLTLTATTTNTGTLTATTTTTLTATPTASLTLTATTTNTGTLTATPTNTLTATPTASLTLTATTTNTGTLTATTTTTLTATPTASLTLTATTTNTGTLTATPTSSPSNTALPTVSPTPSKTRTATRTSTKSRTTTPAVTPSTTITMSATLTPTSSKTGTVTSTPTRSPSSTPTSTTSGSTTITPTPSASVTECVSNGDCEAPLCSEALCESGNCIIQFTDGADCNDQDACTQDDFCRLGACIGISIFCQDGDPCTTDRCDVERGCVFTALVDCTPTVEPTPLTVLDPAPPVPAFTPPPPRSIQVVPGIVTDFGEEQQEVVVADETLPPGDTENEVLAQGGISVGAGLMGLLLVACAGCCAMFFGVLAAKDIEKDDDHLAAVLDNDEEVVVPIENTAFQGAAAV